MEFEDFMDGSDVECDEFSSECDINTFFDTALPILYQKEGMNEASLPHNNPIYDKWTIESIFNDQQY